MAQMTVTEVVTCKECGERKERHPILPGIGPGISIMRSSDQQLYPGTMSLAKRLRRDFFRLVEHRPCEQCEINAQLFGEDSPNDTWQGDTKIVRAPDMLRVVLQRSTYDDFWREVKSTAYVPVDEILDLSEYTLDDSKLRYRLYAVAAHKGESADEGHWLAAVRNPADHRIFNKVSDDKVIQDSHQRHQFNTMRKPGGDSSLFIYMKIDEDEHGNELVVEDP
jgi:hypothetical protein